MAGVLCTVWDSGEAGGLREGLRQRDFLDPAEGDPSSTIIELVLLSCSFILDLREENRDIMGIPSIDPKQKTGRNHQSRNIADRSRDESGQAYHADR